MIVRYCSRLAGYAIRTREKIKTCVLFLMAYIMPALWLWLEPFFRGS